MEKKKIYVMRKKYRLIYDGDKIIDEIFDDSGKSETQTMTPSIECDDIKDIEKFKNDKKLKAVKFEEKL